MFNFGCGCWVNIGKGASPVVRFFSWISPTRYGLELAMRRVTAKKKLQEQVLEHFGYTAGTKFCFGYLFGFALVSFFFGWIVLWAKNRKL